MWMISELFPVNLKILKRSSCLLVTFSCFLTYLVMLVYYVLSTVKIIVNKFWITLFSSGECTIFFWKVLNYWRVNCSSQDTLLGFVRECDTALLLLQGQTRYSLGVIFIPGAQTFSTISLKYLPKTLHFNRAWTLISLLHSLPSETDWKKNLLL